MFFLERSQADSVSRVGKGEAVLRLTEAAMQVCRRFWQAESPPKRRRLQARLFENASDILNSMPAFVLGASLDGSFWHALERALATAPSGGSQADE
jgi:hypothetical protein